MGAGGIFGIVRIITSLILSASTKRAFISDSGTAKKMSGE